MIGVGQTTTWKMVGPRLRSSINGYLNGLATDSFAISLFRIIEGGEREEGKEEMGKKRKSKI